MTQQEGSMFNCPVEATLSLIDGECKSIVLWYLIKGPLRYIELQRLIPSVTPKMLSQQLRGLETSGMISREVVPEKSPRTIYSLTEFSKGIIPVLDVMCTWGTSYLNGLNVKTLCQKQEKGRVGRKTHSIFMLVRLFGLRKSIM